jgi:hypothetical protein
LKLSPSSSSRKQDLCAESEGLRLHPVLVRVIPVTVAMSKTMQAPVVVKALTAANSLENENVER